jgi:hypothetical protein
MTTLTRRKDSNFFHKLHVSTTSFDTPQMCQWNFISIGIALMVESNDRDDVIQYSFDGKTVHGDLTPLLPSEGIVFDNRFQSKVWFRRATPGDPVLVRVEAWRNEA